MITAESKFEFVQSNFYLLKKIYCTRTGYIIYKIEVNFQPNTIKLWD